ncbi:MAG: acyl-CoA carboxylase subunit beta [Planctomycetales bacterium]
MGGGTKAVERQHAKGRLTARERIERLIDPGSAFWELGVWSGWRMYDDWGGAPSAGVVCGIGIVCDRKRLIVANDATVKAGAFFPATVKKLLRGQRISMRNRLPVIYLVDSAGVFLPLQDEVFPDEDDFGRIFRNNAVTSAAGIGQIAAIMGNCVAGGGYLPVLCDKLVMTEGSGLYLAGPALVKSAIGQVVSHEELGGAAMHAQVSGTIDYREPDDEACLRRVRKLVGATPPDPKSPAAPFSRIESREPSRPARDLEDLVDLDGRKDYEARELIACLADAESFEEFRSEHGKSLVCGHARLGGFPVGIIANQHHAERPAQGPLQFGGVLYSDAVEKAARFVMNCNQDWIPLVFLQDVNGFMVGRDSEQEGIIRAGAKLVNAISNSRVPKLTVIVGGSFGAGNYAQCGKAYDPSFIYAWPSARYAVMGAQQASSTLLDVQVRALRREGREIDADEMEQLRQQVASSYEEQTDVRYAAARGWVDKIIDPNQTREALILSLEIVTRHVEDEPFKLGVFQV